MNSVSSSSMAVAVLLLIIASVHSSQIDVGMRGSRSGFGVLSPGEHHRPSTAPPGITHINSGDIPLIMTSPAPCDITVMSDIYNFTSPNYPSPYVKGEGCYFETSSSEPRALQVFIHNIEVPVRDGVIVRSPPNRGFRLSNRNDKSIKVFISTFLRVKSLAKSRHGGAGFALEFSLLNSDCHQILEVEEDAIGGIIHHRFTPGTICEYWLKAAPDHGIAVNTVYFDMTSSTCRKNFILVDVSGDPTYKTNSTKYCVSSPPPSTFFSFSNTMNILIASDGPKYGNGVRFTYTSIFLD